MADSRGLAVLLAGAACALTGLIGFLVTVGTGPAQRRRLRRKIEEEINGETREA